MTEKPLSKYVFGAVVRPSRGKAYVRCGICKRQVFTSVDPHRHSLITLAYVLRNHLAAHIKEEHP